MKILSDYHMHTFLCKHAIGEPKDYLEIAHAIGLEKIGFSDHSPVPLGYDEQNRMGLDQFEHYKKMVDDIKVNKYGIEVLLGLEIDWVPGKMEEVETFIENTKLDYLIGSIHYVNSIPFDNPEHVNSWNSTEGIDYVWNNYFKLLKDFIQWGKFDIIGHIDLPKKFMLKPSDMSETYAKIDEILYIAGENNIMIEINTAGLRKPVKEIYPSLDILKLAYKNGVNVVFGSDSHDPKDVGSGFDEALLLLEKAGYTEYNSILGNGLRHTHSLHF